MYSRSTSPSTVAERVLRERPHVVHPLVDTRASRRFSWNTSWSTAAASPRTRRSPAGRGRCPRADRWRRGRPRPAPPDARITVERPRKRPDLDDLVTRPQSGRTVPQPARLVVGHPAVDLLDRAECLARRSRPFPSTLVVATTLHDVAAPAPDGSRPSIVKIGDLAAAAGLRRIHMLSWRDLADVEAGGSEVHAATVAKLWAEAGIDVTLRTSYAQGQAPVVTRDGYRVIRRAGRYLVFPRAAGSRDDRPPRPARRAGRDLERHAVLLARVGPRPRHRPAAPRPRRDVEDGARRRRTVGGDARRHDRAPHRAARLPPVEDRHAVGLVEGRHHRDAASAASNIEVVPPGIDPMFSPAASGRRRRW